MVLTVELSDEQTLALQLAQYRNGESLSHTLLRLAKLAPEPTWGNTSLYEVLSLRGAMVQQDDARLFQILASLAEPAKSQS